MVTKEMFKIVDGGLSKKLQKQEEMRQRKEDLYFENLCRAVKNEDVKKVVFFGIKFIRMIRKDSIQSYEEAVSYMELISMIDTYASSLTYNEFINIFPIKKDYDGIRFECKDYFSTLEYLSDFDLDCCIGDNINELYWSYYNSDIMTYGVNCILLVDILRRCQGQRSVIEEFADMVGVDTYSVNRKYGYIYNNRTGKTQPLIEIKNRRKNKLIKVIRKDD